MAEQFPIRQSFIPTQSTTDWNRTNLIIEGENF